MRTKQGDHFRDSLAKSDVDGAGNDGMADIECVEMRNVFDILADVGVVEAMAGVDAQAEIVGMRGGAGVARQFPAAGGSGGGVGVVAGVEFDGAGVGATGGVDLWQIGIDEDADLNFGRGQPGDDGLEPARVGHGVKAALGGDFLAVLGHEADFIRLEEKGLANHRRRRGHFEIEGDVDHAGEAADVGRLDMAAIFAQVDGDGLGAALLGKARGLEDAGFGREASFPVAVAGFAKGRDVVNIETELGHGALRVESLAQRGKKIVAGMLLDLPVLRTVGPGGRQ